MKLTSRRFPTDLLTDVLINDETKISNVTYIYLCNSLNETDAVGILQNFTYFSKFTGRNVIVLIIIMLRSFTNRNSLFYTKLLAYLFIVDASKIALRITLVFYFRMKLASLIF